MRTVIASQTKRHVIRSRRCQGFTLIELLIVLIIIGVLLNISVPSYLHARESARSRACIKNLRSIDSAKEQYAMDNRVSSGTPLTTDLYGTSLYIRTAPACPTSGATAYSINAVGVSPTCIIGANLNASAWDDHVLP